MYNSLNWPSYNAKTRELFRNSPDAQVIVATTSFMVGLDFPHIGDVVLLGAPPDPDDYLQWAGRPGRDCSVVQDARCIMYLTEKAPETAQAILDGKAVGKTPRGGVKKKTKKTQTGAEMDADMASLILAKCKVAELNKIYDNPINTPPCTCRTCIARPSTMSSPQSCNCSGCMEDDVPELPAVPQRPSDNNPVPRKHRLRRSMRAVGTTALIEFRWTVYNESDTPASRLLPPSSFFPDNTIKLILDRFALLQSLQDVQQAIDPCTFARGHAARLWEIIQELRLQFEVMEQEHQDGLKTKRQAKLKSAASTNTSQPSRPEPKPSGAASIGELTFETFVWSSASTGEFSNLISHRDMSSDGQRAASSSLVTGSESSLRSSVTQGPGSVYALNEVK